MKRHLFVLVFAVALAAAAPAVWAQDAVYIPTTLGWQGEAFARGSVEQVLRLAIVDQPGGTDVRAGTFSFFDSRGPRSLYLDFPAYSGGWGMGGMFFPSIPREHLLTFDLRNGANGSGDFPNPGPAEDFLVSAETQPRIMLYGWAEIWRWNRQRAELVERKLVVQPPLTLTKEIHLPGYVTQNEDTEIVLLNPSGQTVHVNLEIKNSCSYYSGIGRQGERVFAPKTFYGAVDLTPWQTKVFKVSSFLGYVWDIQGNLLTEGLVKVSASAPILVKIQ